MKAEGPIGLELREKARLGNNIWKSPDTDGCLKSRAQRESLRK